MEGSCVAASTSIIHLPDDCLSTIFRYLDCAMDRDSFGLTCRRWLNIQNTNRGSLQYQCSLNVLGRLSLSQTTSVVVSSHVYRLLSRFQNLERLSLSGCCGLPDSSLKYLKYCGPRLRSLHLDCCFSITDKGVSYVAENCPVLRVVSFYRCTIRDPALQVLVDASLPLTHVNISYCPNISDVGVSAVMQGFPELQALKATNCSLVKGVGLTGPPSSTLAYLDMESCSLDPDGIQKILSGGGIKFLNISGLSRHPSRTALESFESGFASRLRILNLRMCRTIKDDSVIAIATGCPMLQEWNLALCHEIRIPGWEAIAAFCVCLEKLHVNRCRNFCDRSLQAIRNGCQNLSVLYMSGNIRVSPIAEELFKIHRGDVVIIKEEKMFIGPDWSWNSCLSG